MALQIPEVVEHGLGHFSQRQSDPCPLSTRGVLGAYIALCVKSMVVRQQLQRIHVHAREGMRWTVGLGLFAFESEQPGPFEAPCVSR